MNLFKSLIALLFILLCLAGCRDDEYNFTETETPIGLGIFVSGDLNGLVVNAYNEPIAGVRIEVLGETTYTDNYGFFRIPDIPLDNNGSLVKITKEGRLPSYKFTYAQPGEDSYIKHVIPDQGGATYPNSAGYTIPAGNGSQITIPPNSPTHTDGSAYNGRVIVKTLYFDPNDPNLALSMPGDLRGIDSEDQYVQLITYGMIGVELETESGEPLQLTESLPATLKFPIPENLSVSDTIPMWHLDEDTGYWREEGFSIKQGNFMIAKVTHFSYWNCDDPFPLISLQGRIMDPTGTPLANKQVIITTDNQLTGTGYTNETGHFRGKVPQGLDLTLSIPACEDETFSQSLGTLDIDTDLGEIFADVTDVITVNTRLISCPGTVTNAYAFITTDESTDVVIADEDGYISYKLLACNQGNGSIRGVNIETGTLSKEFNLPLDNAVSNIADINICEGEEIEPGTITYDIGGPSINLTDVEVTIVDDTYIYIYGAVDDSALNLEYIQLMYLKEGASHITEAENFLLRPFISGYNANGEYMLINLNPSIYNELKVTPVENKGDRIIGTLEDGDITVTMNVPVTDKINTGRITGLRWTDTNQDGIKDDNESPASSIWAFKVESEDPNQRISRYYRGMPFDISNEYFVHGIIPGQDVKLVWEPSSNHQVSPAFQGDPSKDCDFTEVSEDRYETPIYSIGDGELIEDVGLGFIVDMACQITPRCCPVDGMYFNVKNGYPPFTVEMSVNGMDLTTEEHPEEEFEIFTSIYGTYTIQVTDSQNNFCVSTYEHNEFLNGLNGRVWLDNGNVPNAYDQEDQLGVVTVTLILYNDDGELIHETFSDSNGQYFFNNFKGDRYRIEALLPTGYEFVVTGTQGEDNDSHINVYSGFSEYIEIGDYDFDTSHIINVGIKEQ